MSNAIDWAEDTLGLSALQTECDTEQGVLDDLASHLDNASDEKRTLADKIEDRKTELLIEARGKHPDESQAWMDRHMRVVTHNDPELIAYRKDYQAASSTLSGLEYDWEVQKSKLRILEKKMVQNGGFLNFLAAAKIGEISSSLEEIITAATRTLQTLQTTRTQSETQGD